jgi:uncharacterized membrane protein
VSFGWGVLALLSLGVAGYAIVVYGFLPLGIAVHPAMRAMFEAERVALYTHVFASVLALALGPFQFSPRLRSRYAKLHRWSGQVYLALGVLVGGLAGLYMAFHAYGGAVAQTGFACLALAWLYTGARAYVAIRRRDIVSHRRWMVRNYALTFAAVTLRLWLPLLVLAGAPFELAYVLVAWACWVPNLLAAEMLFNARGDHAKSHSAAGGNEKGRVALPRR